MTITQRAKLHGVECDCICAGRFYDFFERRQRRWGLVLRQPIYVVALGAAGSKSELCASE
jgi:hypothetical protein